MKIVIDKDNPEIWRRLDDNGWSDDTMSVPRWLTIKIIDPNGQMFHQRTKSELKIKHEWKP